MSTLRQPACLRCLPHATNNSAILAIVLVLAVLQPSASRASETATTADVATGIKSAASQQQPAENPYKLFNGIRKLFVGPSELSPEELYEGAAPSVVTILVKDENGAPIATGSGFFVDESLFVERYDRPENDERYAEHIRDHKECRSAYVLTNFHVIESAVSAEIELAGGDKRTVWHVIAEDEKLDLALLSVTVPSSNSMIGIPLAPNDPRVMTTVYAIGSPLGLQGSASEGKVSSYRELLGDDCWLQTTTPVSPGSSGGPLLSADGTLVGITTWIYTEGQNLNFAIPVSVVRTFLATGPFERRDIAEGASIRWHEQKAFEQVQSALWSRKHTWSEKVALTQLLNVRNEIDKALAKPPTAHVNQAIAWVRLVDDSLPKEFEYLRHYLIGKASVSAAIDAEPKDVTDAARTDEANIRYRTNRYATDAAYHLLEGIKLQPDFSPAHRSLYDHHRSSGNTPRALLTSDTLARLVPRSAEALALRAECYRQLGQPATAKNDLEAAIEFSPTDGNLHYQLANVLAGLGEYDDAIERYQFALVCEPSHLGNMVRYQLGVAYRKAGNPEKALVQFRTAKALGWPAELCDAQIAECQPRGLAPPASLRLHHQLPRAPQASIDQQQTIVYVTTTGKKYHRDGCPYLRKSKLPIALNEAADIYEPCAHCRPPTVYAIDSDTTNVAISQRSGPRD